MTKKTRNTANSPKITTSTDLFTCLCRSDLGVRCVKEYRFHSVRKWRFDYAIPEHLVALEVEGGVWTGGRHTSPKGFLGDMEKYNTATIMGWKVLRTTPDDLCTNKTINMLKTAIFGLKNDESVPKTDENGLFLPER